MIEDPLQIRGIQICLEPQLEMQRSNSNKIHSKHCNVVMYFICTASAFIASIILYVLYIVYVCMHRVCVHACMHVCMCD